MNRKPKPNSTALSVLFPKDQLTTSEKQIRAVVKKASFDELHLTYTQMSAMFQLVDLEMREELTKRLGRRKDPQVQTDLGFIKLKERSTYDFDVEGIEKFFSKKKTDISNLFRTEFVVVTKNKKVLTSLLNKGYITESKKVSTPVFTELLKKYKSLAKFVTQKTTQYLTGL